MSEQFLTEVPQHAIRALCRNTGRACAKRPSLYGSVVHHGPHHGYGFGRYWDAASRTYKDIAPAPKEEIPRGNLDEAEYRFWIGLKEPQARWSKCRLCEKSCMSKSERHDHQRETHCTTELIRVYKSADESRPVRRCLSCGCQTSKSRWGVPLCDLSRCITDWKFDHFATGLKTSIRIARASNLIH